MRTPSSIAFRTVATAALVVAPFAPCSAQTNKPAVAEVAATKPEAKADQSSGTTDGFKVGDFTFKPGGRIKLDILRDFKPIGSEDSFDVRTIPVDGSEGTNSNIHAKESRLTLDIRGPAEGKELRMYVEGDFYGSSAVFRLRQAFGSWGGLSAGQRWSTFVDEDNMPRTIDFESPMAYASVRQAQLRWTQKLTDTVQWSVAVEDNKSSIVVPSTPGKAEYPMPDFVTRFVYDSKKVHLFGAGFLGAARFRPTTGDTDTVTLWGGAVTAKFKTTGKDSLYGTFTSGVGIGRYRGGTTAVPDINNELHPVAGNGYMGGYEHFWTDRVSTNAVYSLTDTVNEDFYTSSVNKKLNYGAVNLLYWFLGDRAWTGVEYLYGRREVFGSGNANGTAHRIQYAVRFNLP